MKLMRHENIMHINESSSLVVVGMEAELDVELYTRHVFSRCLDTRCVWIQGGVFSKGRPQHEYNSECYLIHVTVK